MNIGIPKETMLDEYRVGLLPEQAQRLNRDGHRIFIESKAGERAGFSDQMYKHAGCEIVLSISSLYQEAELIIKVKAPSVSECSYLTEKHILFSFLHLASDMSLVEKLLQSKCVAIAYESIETDDGLPILKPMSKIAGQLAIQFGANCLMAHSGGKGILVGRIDSSPVAKIIVLGSGIVGQQAMLVANNMQANVVAMDISDNALENVTKTISREIKIYKATPSNIEREILDADLIIGAVLIKDDKSPVLINEEHLLMMQKNTVLVDVSIDQGGCFATSTPTTHRNPSYLQKDIIHCCVSNLPGCVPISSSRSLCLSSFPYIKQLVDSPLADLSHDDPLLNGINIYKGKLVNEKIGKRFQMDYFTPNQIIN